MLANSGRYPRSMELVLADSPFRNFSALSRWLYAKTRQTHAIAHERMVHLVHEHLIEARGLDASRVSEALIADYRGTGGRSRLRFEAADAELPLPKPAKAKRHTPERQIRHLQT
jgi:hypothetical protein